MHPTTSLWHARFKQQLEWTRSTRDFVYRKLDFARCSSFLELGCGTGALLEEIATRFAIPRSTSGKDTRLVGIDINREFLGQARSASDRVHVTIELKEADARRLPFPDGSFDIVYCHYFLMWNHAEERAAIIEEARRVLRDGGWFIALAEPDYHGWILEPPSTIKEVLVASLSRSGGDAASGRRLAADLAPFKNTSVDCCSKPWTSAEWREAFEAEWAFYLGILGGDPAMEEALLRLKADDKESVESGSKFSFLPVFYGFGRK
ncbi:MAG: class I SAM-dependent methyltransferase [Candidatus Lokiarchaeota archaeon]|nr:class I SAM-dependent methyltransferase [Candidatus Lokiarchaeota archaeon]